MNGGACGCRTPEEWSVAVFHGGRTSRALTLRRARAAQSAVCTRLLVSVQVRARPEPCVARGRPRVLCVRVSVQAHPQHFRRFGVVTSSFIARTVGIARSQTQDGFSSGSAGRRCCGKSGSTSGARRRPCHPNSRRSFLPADRWSNATTGSRSAGASSNDIGALRCRASAPLAAQTPTRPQLSPVAVGGPLLSAAAAPAGAPLFESVPTRLVVDVPTPYLGARPVGSF